jgi:hypothetical protein
LHAPTHPRLCFIGSIKNSLKPDWVTQFTTEYTFGKETRINIGIFDEVRKTGKHISMGSSQFELGEVLGSHGNVKAKHLKNGGTIFCRVTTAAEEDYGTLKLQLRGQDLEIADGGILSSVAGLGKLSPFFVLNAQAAHTGGNRVWHQEYRSEVVHDNDSDPVWNPLEIPIEKLCGGDLDRAIQVEAYSWEKSGKHKVIGKFQTSVNGLFAAMSIQDRGMELVHKSKPRGKLYVKHVEVIGGSVVPPSQPHRHTSSAPPSAIASLAPPENGVHGVASSLPPMHSDSEPLPIPIPPPMSPSSYPIAASESASSLPPALPPPAFDVTEDAKYSSSVTETMSTAEMTVNFSKMPPPSAPQRIVSQKRPKFTDYLSGGLEISLSIAIDFTGSNGDPRVPGTLHYIDYNTGQLNDYQKVLTAVGSNLARYDSDQRFPMYGFGAKYNGVINHCFQVGGASEMIGLRGVLDGYRSVFNSGLTMSGPTVLSEVIQHAAIKAQNEHEQKQAKGKQSYSILLIITDGAVTDEEETKIALKYASSAPLSIVIVGVGNEDFSKMIFLDHLHRSDDGMRDIVKFVEFNQFKHDRQALTAETLANIPNHVVEYFYSKNIYPLPSKVSRTTDFDVSAEDYDSDDDVGLDFSFGNDGAVHIAEVRKASWNPNAYGNASTFASAPRRAPFHGQPTSNASNDFSVSLSPGREKPRMSAYVGAPTAHDFPMAQLSNEEDLIHVKVPPNAQPGMQLRVQNPKNGNTKIVAVPMGVPPGGTFPCRV